MIVYQVAFTFHLTLLYLSTCTKILIETTLSYSRLVGYITIKSSQASLLKFPTHSFKNYYNKYLTLILQINSYCKRCSVSKINCFLLSFELQVFSQVNIGFSFQFLLYFLHHFFKSLHIKARNLCIRAIRAVINTN